MKTLFSATHGAAAFAAVLALSVTSAAACPAGAINCPSSRGSEGGGSFTSPPPINQMFQGGAFNNGGVTATFDVPDMGDIDTDGLQVNRDGGSNVDIDLQLSGDGCGFDCANFNYSAAVNAFEHSNSTFEGVITPSGQGGSYTMTFGNSANAGGFLVSNPNFEPPAPPAPPAD